MAYPQELRHLVKDVELKTKVPMNVREKVEAAAIEDNKMLAAWVREAVLHYLTMREVNRRINAHRSKNHAAA